MTSLHWVLPVLLILIAGLVCLDAIDTTAPTREESDHA